MLPAGGGVFYLDSALVMDEWMSVASSFFIFFEKTQICLSSDNPICEKAAVVFNGGWGFQVHLHPDGL